MVKKAIFVAKIESTTVSPVGETMYDSNFGRIRPKFLTLLCIILILTSETLVVLIFGKIEKTPKIKMIQSKILANFFAKILIHSLDHKKSPLTLCTKILRRKFSIDLLVESMRLCIKFFSPKGVFMWGIYFPTQMLKQKHPKFKTSRPSISILRNRQWGRLVNNFSLYPQGNFAFSKNFPQRGKIRAFSAKLDPLRAWKALITGSWASIY